MNYLLKKAKENGWEVGENCGHKINVYIPIKESVEIIKHLKKLGDKFMIRHDHNYSLCIISFL